MPSKVVYRIQDNDGRGPWKPGFSESWTEDREESEYESLKPIFVDFPDLRIPKSLPVAVGCRTVEQLRRWINQGEYRTLCRAGYRAVRIEAYRILRESDVQCIFQTRQPLYRSGEPFDLYAEEPTDAK